MRGVWWWGQARISLTFPLATQHLASLTASQSPPEHSMLLGSRKWLTYQAWSRDYIWGCHSLDRPPISNAAAPVVGPQFVLWALDSMVLLTIPLWQTAQGYLPDFFRTSWPTSETRNLAYFILTWVPLFTFHARLLWLEFCDALLLGVHDWHQVIGVEKLPLHTKVKLVQMRLQRQDEEQWAKDRALMKSSMYSPLTAHDSGL